MSYTYQYPKMDVTVDCIVFSVNFEKSQLEVLLIRRGNEPFKNCLALPGGFVNMDETLDDAAKRELDEETGFKTNFLEQLYTFGSPNRDPRGRVIAVAYYALVAKQDVIGADDATEAMWMPVIKMLKSTCSEHKLAFDHKEELQTALMRLQGKIRYAPIGFNLLPEKFTLAQLQHLYEIILMKKLHKSNFRTKILSMGILEEVDIEENVTHRPAKIYSFNSEKYNDAVNNGFNFQI